MKKLQPNKLLSKHIITTVVKITTTDLHPPHFVQVGLVDEQGEILEYPFELEIITDEYRQLKKKTRTV